MRLRLAPIPTWLPILLATVTTLLLLTRDDAAAAGFHVNATHDAIDANPGDFICETSPGNGVCTLRAAVMEANALPGADVVTLGEGTFEKTIGDDFDLYLMGLDDDTGATGDIDVLDDLRVAGAGSDVSLVEIAGSGLLDVHSGVSVEISGFAMTGAFSQGPSPLCGSAMRINGTLVAERVVVSGNFARGNGAICNHGDFTLVDSRLSENSTGLYGLGAGLYNAGTAHFERVEVSGNNVTFDGGGIYNTGSLTIIDGTISENVTVGPASSHFGGGIYNKGTMAVTNTTISDNYGQGGGIYNSGTGVLTNVTLAANTTEQGDADAGIRNDGDLTLTNTIVAKNEGGDCFGAVTSAGHNLDSDSTCGLDADGDLSGVDPLLGELADNGGPTMTHALLEGSPAIDAGDDAACPDTDQRGAPRPGDGDGDTNAVCDIGAYEATADVPGESPTPTPPRFPRGDIDCDGDIDSTDALAILRYLVGWDGVPGCPGIEDRADINCDGRIDALDALALLRWVAGLPLALPPGCGDLG